MVNENMGLEEAAVLGRGKKECDCDLGDVLGDVFGTNDRNIAIEFECGGCCKRVSNGEDIDVMNCFVVLRPARNERLCLKLVSGGCVVERQRLREIIIPIDKICSIEIGSEDS